MKSNIKTAIILCLCAVSVITCAAAFRVGAEEKPEPQTVAAMSYSDDKTKQYCLREQDGFIAVFSYDDALEPLTVTDIEVCTLNDNDCAMLKNGINAENKAELISLLEDLGS